MHRGGEHVRGVVADEVERVLAAAIGDDLQRLVGVSGRARSRTSPVLLDRQRGARQPGPDRGGGVGAGGASGSSSGVPSGSVTFIAPDATRAPSPPPAAGDSGPKRTSVRTGLLP